MPHVPISRFRRRQATLELRYDDAFYLWDKAGSICESLRPLFGELRNRDASPSQITFIADDRYGIQIGLNRIILVDHAFSRDTGPSLKIFQSITTTALKSLRVEALTRVGTRFQLVNTMDTKDQAREFINSLRLNSFPPGKLFGIEPVSMNPSYKLEVDGGDFCYIAQIYTQTRSADVDLSPDFADLGLPKKSKKIEEVALDLDFFTSKPVAVGSFDSTRWMDRWLRVLNRDGEAFLNMAAHNHD